MFLARETRMLFTGVLDLFRNLIQLKFLVERLRTMAYIAHRLSCSKRPPRGYKWVCRLSTSFKDMVSVGRRINVIAYKESFE